MFVFVDMFSKLNIAAFENSLVLVLELEFYPFGIFNFTPSKEKQIFRDFKNKHSKFPSEVFFYSSRATNLGEKRNDVKLEKRLFII